MNKLETLGYVFCEIDTSTEISHAMLTELMENSEDDRTQYILLGAIKQLENIKKHLKIFDKTMKGCADNEQ